MQIFSSLSGSAVESMAFSPSNLRIAFATSNRVEVWDRANAASPQYTLERRLQYPAEAMRFRSEDSLLLGGNQFSIVNPETQTLRSSVHIDVHRFALSPNGNWVVMTYGSVFALKRFDWQGIREKWDTFVINPNTGQGEACNGLAIFPDGEHFISLESSFIVRDSRTGRRVRSVPLPASSPSNPQFSPNHQWFALWEGRTIHICDASIELREQRSLTNEAKHHFTGIAFHPSGKYLAATSNDATVKIYDTTTWEVARTFTWQIGKMRSIAFSPDGTLAAAGSDSGKVVIWDVDF